MPIDHHPSIRTSQCPCFTTWVEVRKRLIEVNVHVVADGRVHHRVEHERHYRMTGRYLVTAETNPSLPAASIGAEWIALPGVTTNKSEAVALVMALKQVNQARHEKVSYAAAGD